MKEHAGPKPIRVVVVTGLSGSGKSTVARCFEDLGHHCIDNLPLPLLETFLCSPEDVVDGSRPVTLVGDVRAPGFAQEFPYLLGRLHRDRIHLTTLFLEASDRALVRRFSETRRPHPLAESQPVIDAIREERSILADVRGVADLVFDTSDLTIHEIRNKVFNEFVGRDEDRPSMTVSLASFGFKHGVPAGIDLLFDVRFLPNPYFVEGLREKTGRTPEVQAYLEGFPEFGEVVARLEDLLLFLLPRYRMENRSYLSVAVGCTGGHHRSVAIAEILLELLGAAGWAVRLQHRDIDK